MIKKSLNIVFALLFTAILIGGCVVSPGEGSLTTWPISTTTVYTGAALAAVTTTPFQPEENPNTALQNQLPPQPASPTALAQSPQSDPTSTPTQPAPPPPPVRFAVIGDFGSGDHNAGDVAALVKAWNPDFIVTVGDNNYPDGAAETIDENIGQFYHEYISSYQGEYGPGADIPRFFPTLGNHDWNTQKGQPYLDYFTLPGNERYYDFTWGPVHFFMLSSDSREPDGVGRSTTQAQWFQQGLAASQSPWKLAIMHHPAYSSGTHGSVDWMRWPFKEWGADAALAGHDHDYERLLIDGFPYFINGLGGGAIYGFGFTQDGSQVRYNADYGALFVTADEHNLVFEFFTRGGELIDRFELQK